MELRITYKSIDAFDKDLKRLTKKFVSLQEDLGLAKRAAIELFHIKKLDNHAVFPIPDFCSDTFQVCKIKKFACRSLKGRGVKSGIRVIYFFDIKKLEVVFLEMYFKSEQENEDRERIKEYLKLIG
jgi:hypothetical protein